MKEQYDDYLCRTYPKLYKERRMSMQQTCMCWGFEVGDGWFNILNGLSSAIQCHINHRTRERWRIRKEIRKYAAMSAEAKLKNEWMDKVMPPRVYQVVATQVKEKFGSLRFYYSGGDEAIHNFVFTAECMTYVTCEECGAPGTMSHGGWMSVKCQEHGGQDFFDREPITKKDLAGE